MMTRYWNSNQPIFNAIWSAQTELYFIDGLSIYSAENRKCFSLCFYFIFIEPCSTLIDCERLFKYIQRSYRSDRIASPCAVVSLKFRFYLCTRTLCENKWIAMRNALFKLQCDTQLHLISNSVALYNGYSNVYLAIIQCLEFTFRFSIENYTAEAYHIPFDQSRATNTFLSVWFNHLVESAI